MSDPHVIVEDEILRHGFTQIPNQILRRSDLPPGAKLTYMVLLSYAWQKDHAYPGQDRLALDMGVSERSVITYLKQLVDTGLITIKRRGLGLTNIYIIHRISGSEISAPLVTSEISALPDPQKTPVMDVQDLPRKKTQLEKTQKEEDPSNHSTGHSVTSREESEQIAWIVSDIAREFSDQAPLKSSVSRAQRLFGESGLSVEEFADVLQQARVRTKRYTASIKTERLPNGTRPKMSYWFSIVEDLLKGSGRSTNG